MTKQTDSTTNTIRSSSNCWIPFSQHISDKVEGFVLGCDWYPGEKEDDLRMAICELPFVDAYWCGEITGKCIAVRNSICPSIGHGHNAHWMEIPSDEWVSYDMRPYPNTSLVDGEVLIKLKNGNVYVGFIESWDWCPSYNMFKHGSLDDIEFWRRLPKPPKYLQKPAMTEEQKKKSEEFLKKIDCE